MITETCPKCAFPQAERDEVFDAITHKSLGLQLFCPACHHYEAPTGLIDENQAQVQKDRETARASGVSKLKKQGLTPAEVDALFSK